MTLPKALPLQLPAKPALSNSDPESLRDSTGPQIEDGYPSTHSKHPKAKGPMCPV